MLRIIHTHCCSDYCLWTVTHSYPFVGRYRLSHCSPVSVWKTTKVIYMTSVGMVSVSSLNGGSCRNEAKHLEKAGLSWKMLLFFLLSFFRREDSYVMMNVHKLASIYGSSSGGGHSNPLQDSCLENPMDGGAWPAIDHGVAENQT